MNNLSSGWPGLICRSVAGFEVLNDTELVEALKEISWEARFMAIIDGVLFASHNPVISAEGFQPWIGTGNELERKVMGSDYRDEAKRILTNQTYGTHLGRLARSYQARIVSVRNATERKWKIMPPQECHTTLPNEQ